MSTPPSPAPLQLHDDTSERPSDPIGEGTPEANHRACFEQLFDAVPLGLLLLEPGDRVVRANPAFCRIFGHSTETLVGCRIAELIVPDFLRTESDAQSQRAWEGERLEVETICRRADGSLLDVALQRVAVRVGAEPIAQVAIYRDITEQKRSEARRRERPADEEPDELPVHYGEGQRTRLLTALEAVLGGEETSEVLLPQIARLLVPDLADSCIVYLRDGDDTRARRAAVVFADPEQEELLLEQLARYPLEVHPLIPPVARALQTGEPQLLPEVSISALKALPGDRNHVSIALLLGLVSLLVVPIVGGGRILGALSLATSDSGRRLGPSDLRLADEVCRTMIPVLAQRPS